jgi:thiamine-monophosphate kinase
VKFSEAALIERFLAPFSFAGVRVSIGPGSDCAAVSVAKGQQLVSTTDALVSGVHFEIPWHMPEHVGHKALAVNLSDLAAAGATPRWFLCALTLPSHGDVAEIAKGMSRLAAKHSIALIGGNLSKGKELTITITAMGEAPQPRSRVGAKPGDAIFVAGKLGSAARGLELLKLENPLSWKGPSVAAQRTPTPLIAEGLAARGAATAAIDVSDGFVLDLSRLCSASGVGAEVDCDKLPLGPRATLEQALSGGEDYALIFSVPRGRSCPGVEVGRFVEERGVKLFQNGRPRALPESLGFDHFA